MAAPTRSGVDLDVTGGELVASGTYTADADIPFSKPQAAQGVIVVVQWTAEVDANASIVYTLQGRVPGTGINGVTAVTWDLVSATVTDVGVTVLRVHPGLIDIVPTADADGLPAVDRAGVANDLVPPGLNLNINAADSKQVTYNVQVYFTQ